MSGTYEVLQQQQQLQQLQQLLVLLHIKLSQFTDPLCRDEIRQSIATAAVRAAAVILQQDQRSGKR